MPEVAEVLKATKWLQAHMEGKNVTLHSLTFTETGKYRSAKGSPKNYDVFEENLPACNPRFEARGKKVVCTFDNGLYMIMGLGMAGRFSFSPTKHNCYIFSFTDSSEGEELRYIYFNDSRHFANIHLFVGEESFAKGLKQYAPSEDPLSSNIPLEEWMRLIRNPRRKKTKIITFLLDQRSISGLGNYLTAEILFACRIRPDRPLDEITDEEIEKLKYHTDRLVKLAYESTGRLVYTKAETGPGKGFRCYVYLCNVYRVKRKDGTIRDYEVIGTKYFGTRTTYWCPELQI